jgi:CRP/FNR family transcriptional regulator, cyclic AMP receptor protein
MSGMDREGRIAVIMAAFGCDRAVADTIDAKAHYLGHDAQSTILWRGEESEHACLMLAGRAQAISYSAAGQLVLLYTYGPGDVFGEAAALGVTAGTTESQVMATSPSEVGHFANAVFIGLIEAYSAVALSISRLLTKRLGQTQQRMIEASTLSTVGRIHKELLRQARASGGDMTIHPTPVLSEFALLVQSTRETVSRTINQLEKRGIIIRSEKGLSIVAPHRLEDEIY